MATNPLLAPTIGRAPIPARLLSAGERLLRDLLASKPQFAPLLRTVEEVAFESSLNPWLHELQRARSAASQALQTQVGDAVKVLARRLTEGDDLSAARFARDAARLAERHMVAAAQLGAGRPDLDFAPQASEHLAGYIDNAKQRLRSLATKFSSGDASEAQVGAWAECSTEGMARAAFGIGGMAWATGTVRRVLAPESDHCTTCPGKAQTYPDLQTCLDECGGYPGDGSDDCHGNCNCELRPGELDSTFEDTRQSLAARGGRAQMGAAQRAEASKAAWHAMIPQGADRQAVADRLEHLKAVATELRSQRDTGPGGA